MCVDVRNPRFKRGGIKLFGKPPTWPESLDAGYSRFLVRMETYIKLSASNRQNYIIVSHAPAVGAMLEIFQHGRTQIDDLAYCARVIASRVTAANRSSMLKNIYMSAWTVDTKGME